MSVLATHSDAAPPVWRVPEGPEGLAAVPVGGRRARAENAPNQPPANRRHWCEGRRRVRRARAGLEIDHSERSSRVAISRAAGPDGAQNTGGAPSNNTLRGRLAGGPPPTGTHSGQTKTHQPRGGRRSGGARTTGARANRPYSPPPGSGRPV